MFTYVAPATLACTRSVLLLSCFASFTGSPSSLSSRPAFEVMTPAGIASVSVRQSPLGMSGAEFTRLVRAGMERAAYPVVNTSRIEPPYPSERIIWHVNPSSPTPSSRLIVNVFDGNNPYAYQEDTVYNDASPAVIESEVEAVSERLLGDIAVQAKAHQSANGQTL